MTRTDRRRDRRRAHRFLSLGRTGVAIAATVLALAACSPPGAGTGASDSDLRPTSVSKNLGSTPVSLVLYDGAGLKTIDDALIAAFEKKHPTVTIETRYDPDDVQATNAPRVLSSSTPPDIARINALSDIVKDDLLTKLDAYSKLYSWSDVPAGQLAYGQVDKEGVRGSGSQYTMASGFTVTGFYYNKALAAKLGVAVPKTFNELDGVLAKAAAQGVTPIMSGNQTGGAVMSLQTFINNSIGRDAVNKWVYHSPSATIDSAKTVDAAKAFDDWVSKGYFNKDMNGTDAAGAISRFTKGESLLFFSGNWDAPSLSKQLGNDLGFFLTPAGADGKPVTMSDPASAFGIPAGSKHKNAAAAFLNFLTSPEARQIAVDNGFAPSGLGTVPKVPAGSIGVDVQAAFSRLVESDGQVQFVQNATNGISAVWMAQTQLLAGSQQTPKGLVSTVQQQYLDQLGK